MCVDFYNCNSGEFKKYAIKWQTSPGCQIAGFLGVLSSELSVFTLTVITLERFYAITHAMHLNKRMSIKKAGEWKANFKIRIFWLRRTLRNVELRLFSWRLKIRFM